MRALIDTTTSEILVAPRAWSAPAFARAAAKHGVSISLPVAEPAAPKDLPGGLRLVVGREEEPEVGPLQRITGETVALEDGEAVRRYTVEGPTWDDIRAERDRLLRASDWTQLHDAPLDGPTQTAWATYRQELRDLPETYAETGPGSVVWPTPPGA